MSLFSKLFSRTVELKECPRCLGKGHVSDDDIKRLNKELYWIPGPCAYCGSSGKIRPEVEQNVPVDTGYLVCDLPEGERKMLLRGHPDALDRASRHEEYMEKDIEQMAFLHFNAGLTAAMITEFYLLPEKDTEFYEEKFHELKEYVETLIAIRKNKA